LKILHTADWHLGKWLYNLHRLPEQKTVLKEIVEIADTHKVDAILIAGDIYDQFNPSSETEELLYQTLKTLTNNGQRPVIAIAGNHDSPLKIAAPDPLARACGIIFSSLPNTKIEPFELESGIVITKSDNGFIELKLPDNQIPLRFILTPYVNEVRLKRAFTTDNEAVELRETLQQHWAYLAKKYCNNKGINILVTHLYVMEKDGERPEEDEDEDSILQRGGAQAIYTENIPSQIQYVALGHLHRYQVITQKPCPVVYSGSPLSYSLNEPNQQKNVVILDIQPNKPVKFENIPLKTPKKLVAKEFNSVKEAMNWLEKSDNILVELTIIQDTNLSSKDRKLLLDNYTDKIIDIHGRMTNQPSNELNPRTINRQSKSIEELFYNYFTYKKGQEPNAEIMELFKEVVAVRKEGDNE